MTWLQIIGVALQVTLAFVTMLRERRLLQAGEADAIREALEETNARVEKALAARRAAGAAGMQDDDPYLRD
ncbi:MULTISPECIES: hypothetical protein [Rhodomicrobium]|uniref:hypothetical protein n=1 Tax=Rhodomicrobium TaxID=1068 RepID=UPI000B4A9D2E|nr:MULTISPECIES: hypothetical protein [Rhodomicrobium]